MNEEVLGEYTRTKNKLKEQCGKSISEEFEEKGIDLKEWLGKMETK